MFNNFKENINCPYCNGKSSLLFKGKDYNKEKSIQEFNLYKCSSCKLHFISNPPSDLGKYYEDYHYIPKDVEELENLATATQQFKIDLVSKFKTSGKLLEIGSSIGDFACLAKKIGFDVTVIEMDETCVDFLNTKLKIKAIKSDNPQNAIKENNEKFDVICMWHSLEHMEEPWKVLEVAIEHLNKDGILLIAVPNPDCVQIKIMGKYWPHFDLPRHLFAFPISWLVEFSKKHNLEPLLVTTKDKGSIFWNRFSWAMIMRKLCFVPSKKDKFWNKCLKFAKIFSFIEDIEGKGATYTAIFQKQ